MSQGASEKKKRAFATLSLIAAIIIGLTFLLSGTGKIAGFEDTPAQVVDFITSIVPEFFLTPLTVAFLYKVLIPYVIPWLELILGVLLVIGFMPRLIAIFCLPLLLAFMGTNIWSIVQGGYTTCASCFGIWERIFGSLTPVQSLLYDIVLFVFALLIIILYQGKLLSSRKWLVDWIRKRRPLLIKVQMKLQPYSSYLYTLISNSPLFKRSSRRLTIGIAIVVALAFIVTGLVMLITGAGNAVRKEKVPEVMVSHVTVSEITETSAVISWKTEAPTASSIAVYDQNAETIRFWIHKTPTSNHRMVITGLMPDTLYYFDIASPINVLEQELSREQHFVTMPPDTGPLLISNVEISELTESTVTISWTTNKPSTSEVEYWLSGASETSTVDDSRLVISHNVTLTELDPEAPYQFRVRSSDAIGSQSVPETVHSFTLAIGVEVGKQAPDFALGSLDGTSVKLSDYRGKMVMLYFWMWTCPGCREKMAIIQEAFNRMPRDRTMILCIHVRGNESAIQSYVAGEKLTVPVLIDSDASVAELYELNGVPTSFFIDSDGFIRSIDPQFDSADELENIFDTTFYPAIKSELELPGLIRIASQCC